MATVKEPRMAEGWGETDRRVRHPLEAVRKHIRTYVTLEGLGIAVLYLAGMLWLGLLIDWGVFHLFALDWVQELQSLTAGKGSDFWLRLALLVLLIGGLIAVVAMKVVVRQLREFSDTSVALLLERRFPRELGDRLITAVELADPSLAETYGYSAEMVRKTIRDAAERVEKLPVADVFNWARLRMLFVQCGLVTVGVYVVLAIVTCVVGAATGGSASPIDFLWRYNDVASIFAERNLLLMDTYWPRRAYLEVVGFQASAANSHEMRVGRDEQRPKLQVRASEWVVADRTVRGGWRPMVWSDLSQFLDAGLLAKVDISKDWPGWAIDLDDLHPDVPLSVVPAAWQDKKKSSGDIRAEMDEYQNSFDEAKVTRHVTDLLDWRTWTVDRLLFQLENEKVRGDLRQQHVDAVATLEKIGPTLEELAESPSMTRRLRRLTIPKQVTVYYRGKTIKNEQSFPVATDNKFTIGLNDVKESVTFTVRGEDYYTPYKEIILVPPPGIASLVVDKQEPAYTHYRLQGEQMPLKGQRQIFQDHKISVTGDVSVVQVPLGTSLELIAEVESGRELKEGIRIAAPEKFTDPGSIVPTGRVTLDDKKTKFSLKIENVVKTYEFFVDYLDKDNVKGRRRVLVRPVDDRAPELFDVEQEWVPRKPRFKQAPGKTGQGTVSDSFLITPDAALPIKARVKDDYGLTRVEWVYEVEQVEIELMGEPPSRDKGIGSMFRGNSLHRRIGWIGSGLQFTPGSPGLPPVMPEFYWLWMNRMFAVDLTIKSQDGEKTASVQNFEERRAQAEEIPLAALENRLKNKLVQMKPFNEIAWKDCDITVGSKTEFTGFNLAKHLPQLKSKNPEREAQLHYQLRLSLSATDNNVESGPSSSRTKVPLQFLIVSENELLAQVGLDEELLSEKLEKVYEKLKAGKTTLADQQGKLSTLDKADPKYEAIAIRVDEVRKALMDGATLTREVHTDYSHIKTELEVNRVKKERRETVADQIVFPLGKLVDSKEGDFALVDEAVQKLHEGLEDDANQFPKGNTAAESRRPERIAMTRKVHDQVDELMNKVNAVLIIMQQEVSYAKTLEIAIGNERRQRRIAEEIAQLHQREVERLFNELLNPQKK